jgi:hypothetical protein
MMYSPEAGDPALAPRARCDNKQMSKKRFIELAVERLFMRGAKFCKWWGAIAERAEEPRYLRGRPGDPSLPIWLNLIAD